MGSVDLRLYAGDYDRLRALLDRLHADASARIVFLLDRSGQPIASWGELGDTDTTSLASLAAGNVAATDSLAKLVGEREFATLYHEGERDSLHMSAIGRRMILVVVFDERSSLGLVRLRVKLASAEIAQVIEEIEIRSAAAAESPDDCGENDGLESGFDLSDITDADINALFESRVPARP